MKQLWNISFICKNPEMIIPRANIATKSKEFYCNKCLFESIFAVFANIILYIYIKLHRL